MTFDVGGTLIEPWQSVGQVYADVAASHGWPGLSAETLNRQFARAWQEQANFGYTRHEWASLVEASFSGVIAPGSSAKFFNELYERFATGGAWRIFEDVLPTMRKLRARGLKLTVISNWDDRLPVLLERLGLLGYFDSIVVSCQVGATKPSPAIFAAAARALGLPPAAILHVGDSLGMDVEGGRAAGFRTAHLRRAKAEKEGEIDSLCGIEGLLNSPMGA